MRIGKKVRRALAVAAAIALVFSIESTNLAGSGSLAARGHAFMDALTLIASRSPGERISAFLTKTKLQHAPAADATDRQARALPRTRTPKPDLDKKFEPFREAAAAPARNEELPLLAFNPPGELIPGFPYAPGGGGGTALPPNGGVGGLPPWGGGGIGGPGGGTDTKPTEPPPAVPEPATWAVWMLGFGMLGWVLRRRSGASATSDA